MNSKILSSILVMGVALMMGVTGAIAVFSDTEASRGNTFQAGELDLKMDANSYYYREGVEPYDTIILDENDYGGENQNPGTMINFSDVKPGDRGELEISLHVYDNPAHIWMSIPLLDDYENGFTEPENEVDDTLEEGELSQNIQVTVLDWDDVEIFSGTLEGLYEMTLEENVYLGVLENCVTEWITVEWEVPIEVGNIIQSDSVEFDIEFYAEQERHNSVEQEPVNEA